MTDMISHGQAAAGGTGTKNSSGNATMPASAEINTIARNGSSLILISAFQEAWQAAATRTAPNTNGSTAYPFSLAPAGSYGALRLARTGTRSPAMSISKRLP